jgi:hypothetical protein
VEPVEVNPDIVSKKALVKVKVGNANKRGMVASAEVAIQTSVTNRKPSLGFSSRRQPVVAATISNPVPVLLAAPTTKYSESPSPVKIEQPSGNR